MGCAVKFGQRLFQSAMAGISAVQHPRAGGAGALFIERLVGGLDAGFIEGEAKIVVGAGQHRMAAVDDRLGL